MLLTWELEILFIDPLSLCENQRICLCVQSLRCLRHHAGFSSFISLLEFLNFELALTKAFRFWVKNPEEYSGRCPGKYLTYFLWRTYSQAQRNFNPDWKNLDQVDAQKDVSTSGYRSSPCKSRNFSSVLCNSNKSSNIPKSSYDNFSILCYFLDFFNCFKFKWAWRKMNNFLFLWVLSICFRISVPKRRLPFPWKFPQPIRLTSKIAWPHPNEYCQFPDFSPLYSTQQCLTGSYSSVVHFAGC